MRRRMLALCLTLGLLMSVLPVGALAADPSEDPTLWKSERFENQAATVDRDPYQNTVRFSAGPTSYDDAKPRDTEDEVLRPGIDVSQYQGEIDWEAVAEAGIEFAIVRVAWRGYGASGSLNEDTTYVTNIKEAQANGIKVGAYIFSQAISVEEAVEEADYLMACLEKEGLTVELPLVIDFEYAGDPGRLEAANLTRQEATDICNAFCAQVQSKGYEGMTYANRYFLESKLFPEQLGKVWLANFGTATGYKGDYEYWQFSSRGQVAGISGVVDLDFWFEPNGTPETRPPFWDVRVGEWFYGDVKWAYENEIVNGVTDITFEPGSTAVRGHIITMLYRMAGNPAVSGDTKFTDVPADMYYRDAVRWAELNNITEGVSATEFGPNMEMTREQLVTMLYRMAGSPETSQSLAGFSDGDQVASWAQNAMAWAVEKGLIGGYEDGTLRPSRPVNRAEVCKILRCYSELE